MRVRQNEGMRPSVHHVVKDVNHGKLVVMREVDACIERNGVIIIEGTRKVLDAVQPIVAVGTLSAHAEISTVTLTAVEIRDSYPY